MKRNHRVFTFILVIALLFSNSTIAGIALADSDVDEELQDAAAEAANIAYHAVCDICPVEVSYAKNIRVKTGAKQGDPCVYSFDTVYGHFTYEIDLNTGKATAIEEPDIEDARSQQGFREPMDYDELLDALFDACPIDFTQTSSIRCRMRPDDSCSITFGSAYGDFLYVIDPYTGKILDREEPDIESVKADPNFRERLSIDEVITCVFRECPIDITAAKDIKSSLRADNYWTLTFGSAYGDFLYVVDPYGEMISKSEPDIEAAKKEGVQEPLDAEGIINRVFDQCPINIGAAKNLKAKPGKNDVWTVSFGSEYGDFLYLVDGNTGDILERTEPDIEAVKTQDGFQEKLDMEAAMNRAFDACPLKVSELRNIRPAARPDGNWTVTFDSDYGSFLYVVDGSTGEILERSEPEIP